jgi:hypothetical protein
VRVCRTPFSGHAVALCGAPEVDVEVRGAGVEPAARLDAGLDLHNHAAGTGFAWLIHARWGISDSSEQFVLLSGLSFGSVFALKWARDGFATVARDLGRRVVRLWRTHLVFVLFATMVLTADRPLPHSVPMDAFYEWSGERPPKQPWAVARRDGQEMLVAGLWDGWRAADGSILRSFALITTDANETLRPIHHRMPVIIDATEVEIWLGDDANAAAALMRPAPDDVLRAWPVSRAVNDVRRDGPELLEPVA